MAAASLGSGRGTCCRTAGSRGVYPVGLHLAPWEAWPKAFLGPPPPAPKEGGADAGSALGKPCSLPAPTPGVRTQEKQLPPARHSPQWCCGRRWSRPESGSHGSGFCVSFPAVMPKPQLGLCSPPLPACSPYPVSITQHEITALLDFQLPFGMRGNSSAGLVGGPGYPETQKESDLLEENKTSPECASAGWGSRD